MSAVFAGDSNFFGSASPTLTQTVNIVSLRVSTFTPTATGFTAIFNRPLSLGTVSSPVLNLYDNSSCTLGPEDITLVRASNGASIRGSLVVDPTATQITFIQTGQTGVLGSAAPETLFGVLPNDTYTVTLRSASNGFQDTTGNLLDGNGDGTAGDNYVTTFVVSNPANSVIVSLPDFARGSGQDVNVPPDPVADTPGSPNGLPIRLLNNDSGNAVTVHSLTFNLTYDPTLLTVTGGAGGSGASADAVVHVDTGTAGVAVVSLTSSTGLILAAGSAADDVVRLTASVPSTAGYGAKEILDLQGVQINGGSVPAVADDAVHVVAFLGDASGDGIYTGLDAQRISRVAVGLDPGFRQWPLADPLIIADVSGDNQLTGFDSLTVARQAVGISQSIITPLPAATPTITGPDPLLSIGQAEVRGQRSEVSPDVQPGSTGGGAGESRSPRRRVGLAWNLSIAYDTSRVDVASAADVVRGSLTQTFDNFTVNLDRAAGIIYISGYRGLVSGGVVSGEWSGGSLALITFHVKDNAPAGPAIINLLQDAGSTVTALGGTDARGNDFLFDLEPRPSNAAGDALDGRVVVVAPPTTTSSSPVLSPGRQPQTGAGNGSEAVALIVSTLAFGSRLNGGCVPTDVMPTDHPAPSGDFFQDYSSAPETGGSVDVLLWLVHVERARDSKPLLDLASEGNCQDPLASALMPV